MTAPMSVEGEHAAIQVVFRQVGTTEFVEVTLIPLDVTRSMERLYYGPSVPVAGVISARAIAVEGRS
jgi:hypothetical protein